MDLKELTNTLKEKIALKELLTSELKDYEQTFANILQKNYKTLYVPKYAELRDMDDLLRKELKMNFISGDWTNGDIAFVPAHFASSGLFHHGHRVTDILNPADYVHDFEDIFSSEDSTIKFIDKMTALFCERFKKYEKELDKQNSSLREALATILDKLSNASAVDEKPDGTIEITLNGKTYIGTVKEA